MEEFIANTNAIRENIKILKKYSNYYAKKKDSFKKNAYGSENCTSISNYLQKINQIYETIAKNTDNIIDYLEQYVNDIENVEQVMSNTGNGSINASNTRAHANKYKNHLKKYDIPDEDIFTINNVTNSSFMGTNSGIAVNVDNPFASANSSGKANIGNAMAGFNAAVFGFDHVKREGNSAEYKEMCTGEYVAWGEMLNQGNIEAFTLDKLSFEKILNGYIFTLENQTENYQLILDDFNKQYDELETLSSQIELIDATNSKARVEEEIYRKANQIIDGTYDNNKEYLSQLGISAYQDGMDEEEYYNKVVSALKTKDPEFKYKWDEVLKIGKESNQIIIEKTNGKYQTYDEIQEAMIACKSDILLTEEAIREIENQAKMAPYTLLPFLEDYQNYRNNDDIITPLEEKKIKGEKLKNLAEACELDENYQEIANIYNYLYETEGENAANAYLDATEDSVNQIIGQNRAAEFDSTLSSGNECYIDQFEEISLRQSKLKEDKVKKIAGEYFNGIVSFKDAPVEYGLDKYYNSETGQYDITYDEFVNIIIEKDSEISTQWKEFESEFAELNKVIKEKTGFDTYEEFAAYEGKYVKIINENGEEILQRAYSDEAFASLTDYLKIAGKGMGDGVQSFGAGIAAWFESSDVYSVDEYETMYLINGFMNAQNSQFYDDTYNISQSIGNMLPGTALSAAITFATGGLGGAAGVAATTASTGAKVAQWAGAISLGVSAGGNAYHQSLVEGYSQKDAMLYGFFNGLSEAGLEKVGGILGIGDVEINSLKTYFLASAREGLEESCQEVLDSVNRKFVFGEEINWQQTAEAALQSGIYGSITANVMNGASLTVNAGISGINSYLNSNVNSFSQITNMSNMISERYQDLHREQFNEAKDKVVNKIKETPNQIKEKAQGAYEALNNFKEKLAKDIAQKNENTQILNSDKVQKNVSNEANLQTEKVSNLNIKETYESINNMSNYELKNYLSSLTNADIALVIENMPLGVVNKVFQNLDASTFTQIINQGLISSKGINRIVNINEPSKIIEILDDASKNQNNQLINQVFETIDDSQIRDIEKLFPGFKELYQNKIEGNTTNTNTFMNSYKQYDFSPEGIKQLATDALNKLKNNPNNYIYLAEHLINSLEEASLNGSKESYFILETINQYASSETVFNPQTGDLIQPLEIKLTDEQNQTSSCAGNKIYIEPHDSNIKEVIFHELGHALHWLTLEWTRPQDYDTVIEHTKANLNNDVLNEYCNQSRIIYNKIYKECFFELSTNNESKSFNINVSKLITQIKDNIKYFKYFKSFQFNTPDILNMISKIYDLHFLEQVHRITNFRFRTEYPSLSGISDIIDAMYSGKPPFKVKYLHGEEYYKAAPSSENLAFEEMIANFTSIVLNDKENLGYIKGLFGEEYYSMLKDTFEKFNPNLQIIEDFETKTDLKDLVKKENLHSQENEITVKLDNNIDSEITEKLDNIIDSEITEKLADVIDSEITEKLDDVIETVDSQTVENVEKNSQIEDNTIEKVEELNATIESNISQLSENTKLAPEVQSIVDEFVSLNDWKKEAEFLKNTLFNTEKINNDTLLDIVDNLIETDNISKLDYNTVFELFKKNEDILHKIAKTDLFKDFIYKNLEKNIGLLAPSILKLDNNEFNELFNSPEIQNLINQMGYDNFYNIDSKLNSKWLENDAVQNKLLSLDSEEFGRYISYRSATLTKIFKQQVENDNVDTYKHFLEIVSDKSNLDILKTDYKYYMSIKSYLTIKTTNEEVNVLKNDLQNLINQYDTLFQNKLQEHSKLDLETNILGGIVTTSKFEKGYYDITLEINGEEQIITVTPGYDGKINFTRELSDNQELLTELFQDNLEIKAINKNKFTISENDGLKKGLNQVEVKIDGQTQNYVIQNLYNTIYNMQNKVGNNVQNFEVVKVTPLDSYNLQVENKDAIYKVEFILENNETKEVYLTPDKKGIIDIDEYIEKENIAYIKNVETNIVENNNLNADFSLYDTPQSIEIFSDKKYGGNQSDVYNLINDYLTNNTSSDIEQSQVLNNLIDKYFPNASDLEKIELAANYATNGCGYIAVANAFLTYMNNQTNGQNIFEQKFGYKIKNDQSGSYNTAALAFEMYLNLTKTYCGTVDKVINSSDGYGLSMFYFNQVATKFFQKYGIEINFSETSFNKIKNDNIITSAYTQLLNNSHSFNILTAANFDMEFLNVGEESGQSLDGALKNSNNKGNIKENVGDHAMLVMGIDNDGNLIVSSWGRKYKVDLNTIEKNNKKYENTKGNANIWSIDFNMVPEENIENINIAEPASELNSQELNVEEELSNANEEIEKIPNNEDIEKIIDTETTEKLDNNIDSEITETVKTATTEKLNNYLTNLKYSDHGFLHSIADSIYSKLRKYIYTNTNKFIGLNEKILDEGLYHFTSEKNIDKILKDGYIRATGPVRFYGNPKTFFFCGVPEIGAYVTNLDALPLTATALKINPGLDIIESNKLKVRNMDDSAITYDGNLKLNKVYANKAYFVLAQVDNELKYVEASKKYYDEYANSEEGKRIANFIQTNKVEKAISRDWFNRVVNKLAGGALLERNWQYKNENNTYDEANLNFMKYEILSTIEDDWSPAEKARKLYIELNKRFHYDLDYDTADKNNKLGTKATIYNQDISFDNITSNSVICKGWSQLYSELLIASGINPKDITIMGKDKVGSHKWVEVKVDPEHIIIADATDAINHANDLVNSKSGLLTNGFIYADKSLSHKRIYDIQEQINIEEYSKQWLNVDKKLGIVNSEDYFSENLQKANELFANDKNLNPIDEVNNIINIPIPDIMDGFEAYVYLGNIIYNQLDNKQVKVSKEYRNFKINNTNEPICLLSFELEDSTIYMTYSQSTGKQVFNDYDSYKAFIDTLEK